MKNIILTGASSGIGQAVAKALDNGAYRIAIAGRNKERLEALGKELSCEYIIHQGDVRDYADSKKMIETCIERWGQVDVLINNAGLGYFDPLDSGKIDEWNAMVDINIKGILNCLHVALPSLKACKGHVINVGSVASHQVFPNSGVYSATKHAVLAISQSMRIELNGQVKVTTISPGPVDTDFINKTSNQELADGMREYFASALRPSDVADQVRHVIESPDSV
ncbi:UNVERIFIED_CONTAM: hypothetical protein GTU68_021957, partial [Idotea baltica]|nr:hypothetical protein [Idotea baltica]